MLRWAIIVVAVIGGIVGLAALAGLTLPKGHRAAKTATYPAPPDRVFDRIADVARYADWRGDVKRIELLADDGRGVRFREVGGHGPIAFRVESSQRPSRFVVRIDDPSQPFGGTWTHELQATAEGGTSHTITEDGEVYNPIFRLMARVFMSPTASIEAYQESLRSAVR